MWGVRIGRCSGLCREVGSGLQFPKMEIRKGSTRIILDDQQGFFTLLLRRM